MEKTQKEIQENIQKCYSKRNVRFANANFLVFHLHNQKHKLKFDSELEDALAAIDNQYQPFRTRNFDCCCMNCLTLSLKNNGIRSVQGISFSITTVHELFPYKTLKLININLIP